jgi:serine/threonine-protein kinase
MALLGPSCRRSLGVKMQNYSAKKWGYMLGIGLGIIFVTAFLTSQVVLPLIFGRPDTIQAPEVIGLSLSKAKRILQEEKIHVVVKDSLFSETVRLDVVMDQSPGPGSKIKEDGTMFLVVSKGSKMVKVPDVLGLPFQDAMLSLRNYELRSTIVDSMYSSRYPQNSVVKSIPSANSKVEKRSLVKLTLSRGTEPVPDSLSFLLDESGL